MIQKFEEAKIFLKNHKASSVYGLTMYLGIEKIETLKIIKLLLLINYIQKVPIYENGNIIFLI
jgi:hypothetical protein